jgi:serine protease
VVVAVIDTGVVPGHPDLQGQLVSGYDFVSSPLASLDGDGCDADPSDPGDGGPGASSWHGTHVTGTLAARASLAPGAGTGGVAGVAWNARVMPLRALGFGGGSDFDLIQALRYAAGLPNACNALPAQPADVVNLSLGSPAPSGALEAALAEVRAAGLVLVAAAGNSATSAPFYPAAYPSVLSVAAVDATRRLAPYSNFGDTIDLAAPGGDFSADLGGDGFGDGVLSTWFDPLSPGDPFGYAFSEGTSMAAPHVAGVVALMLGVNPALGPPDVEALLAQGRLTEPIGSSFLFGQGLVDAAAAVRAAYEVAGGAPPVNAPRLRADPPALGLGAIASAAELVLSNAGGDDRPLVVESVSADTSDGAPWLSVAALEVDANGLGRYRATVDRSLVPAGVYTGVLRFASSENDVEVAVWMQAGSLASGAPDAGRHFVLLVDPATRETAAALAVSASGGRYRYRFSGIERGGYWVVAGTDLDNDGVICDPGEACGAYRTLGQPERVEVAGDRSGLDFSTGFGLRLSGAGPAAPQGGFSRALRPTAAAR